MSETIAAISTAQGAGGIGVIRISGDRAKEVADRVFVSPTGKTLRNTPGYTARYGKIHDQDGPIDEAVALVFDGPKSYTGEDVVELSCHGGLYLTRRVLRTVLNAGASPAGPGEFTRRAFLNGKLGLTEAEAVMDLISAQGRQAARAALAGREGALHRQLEEIKETLLSAAAHLAAWADYPEEEIPQVERSALYNTLALAQQSMSSLLDRYDAGRTIREGVDTVIAGRPNVGKSTLMNLLSGCQRSIVTDIPGTTRDVVEETVLVGEIPLRLADTAGIRLTDDPVERIGVELAQRRVDRAGLVLAVFDVSDELNQDDLWLLDSLQGIPAVAVVNKTDLPARIDQRAILQKVGRVVPMSASSGEGLKALEEALADVLGTGRLDPSAGMLATERQRDAAARCGDCVLEALEALESGVTLDAVTVSIEDAVQNLLELTGERISEAVVDQVFHRFCVGK